VGRQNVAEPAVLILGEQLAIDEVADAASLPLLELRHLAARDRVAGFSNGNGRKLVHRHSENDIAHERFVAIERRHRGVRAEPDRARNHEVLARDVLQPVAA
jgi:hypothetical protein